MSTLIIGMFSFSVNALDYIELESNNESTMSLERQSVKSSKDRLKVIGENRKIQNYATAHVVIVFHGKDGNDTNTRRLNILSDCSNNTYLLTSNVLYNMDNQIIDLGNPPRGPYSKKLFKPAASSKVANKIVKSVCAIYSY